MNEYRLASMSQNAIAFDRETEKIQPGMVAPPPVLGSASELGPHEFFKGHDLAIRCRWCGKQPGEITEQHCFHGVLLDDDTASAVFEHILDNPGAVVCTANGAFDFLVEAVKAAKHGKDIIPKIFAMYDPNGTIIRGECDGRVFEIQLAEPLHAIAQGHLGKHALTKHPLMNKETGRQGRYSLDNVCEEAVAVTDAKGNDRFRLGYAQFRGKPLQELPWEARQYPVDDSNNTLHVALAQAGHLPSANIHEWVQSLDGNEMFCRNCKVVHSSSTPNHCMIVKRRRNIHDLARQAYFAWAAYLGAAWGFHVPQEEVDKLENKYTDLRTSEDGPYIAAGIIREDGSENQSVLKRLVAVAYGARDVCMTCAGGGKVPSPKTNGKTKINCDECDGTGLQLPPTVPRSKAGGISKDHDSLQESGDELLVGYGEREGKKILSTFISLMRRGRACNCCGLTGAKTRTKPAHEAWCQAPNGELGYRPIPLIIKIDPLKETNRTAVEDGLHSMPRKGGVRECFVARPGYVFSSVDYTAGELVTVSWACLKLFGYSRLAEVMNRRMDPHIALAGTMTGKAYDEMMRLKKLHDKIVLALRQGAKNANFGFWGGMAELTFVIRKRSEKGLFTICPNGPSENEKGQRGFEGFRPCIVMDGAEYCGIVKIHEYNEEPCAPVCKACVAAAKRLREFFKKQWLEYNDLAAWVKKQISHDGPSGTPEIEHLVSKRVRGGLGFCDGMNGIFQEQLAFAMKNAYCQIQRECVDKTWRVRSSEMMLSRYDGCESPLQGSRAIVPFHDEVIGEHPRSVASHAAIRESEIMVEALRWACPELYNGVLAPPALMERLYKGAEPVWERGLLKDDGEIDHSEPADEYDQLVCWEP